jgi:hypothetical protein
MIGGYKSLVDHLANGLHDSILLGRAVASIVKLLNGRIEVTTIGDSSSSGTPNNNNKSNNNNSETTSAVSNFTDSESSRVFLADRVVVTVPLGVLKTQELLFTPTLSRDKLNAISRLGMGRLLFYFFFLLLSVFVVSCIIRPQFAHT